MIVQVESSSVGGSEPDESSGSYVTAVLGDFPTTEDDGSETIRSANGMSDDTVINIYKETLPEVTEVKQPGLFGKLGKMVSNRVLQPKRIHESKTSLGGYSTNPDPSDHPTLQSDSTAAKGSNVDSFIGPKSPSSQVHQVAIFADSVAKKDNPSNVQSPSFSGREALNSKFHIDDSPVVACTDQTDSKSETSADSALATKSKETNHARPQSDAPTIAKSMVSGLERSDSNDTGSMVDVSIGGESMIDDALEVMELKLRSEKQLPLKGKIFERIGALVGDRGRREDRTKEEGDKHPCEDHAGEVLGTIRVDGKSLPGVSCPTNQKDISDTHTSGSPPTTGASVSKPDNETPISLHDELLAAAETPDLEECQSAVEDIQRSQPSVDIEPYRESDEHVSTSPLEKLLKGESVNSSSGGCSVDVKGSDLDQPPADRIPSQANPNDQPQKLNDIAVSENDEAKSPGSEIKKLRLQPNRWITGLKKALSTRSFDVDVRERSEVDQLSAQTEDPAGVAEESGAHNRTLQVDQHASDSVTYGTSTLGDNDNIGGEGAEPKPTENKPKGVFVDDPGERRCSSDANGSGIGQLPADWNTSHPNPNDQPEESNDVTVATGENDEAKSPGSETKKSRLQPNRWITGLKKALSTRSFDVDEREKSEVDQLSAQTEDPAGVAEESGADNRTLQVDQHASDSVTSGTSTLGDNGNIGGEEAEPKPTENKPKGVSVDDPGERRCSSDANGSGVGQPPADWNTSHPNPNDQPEETNDVTVATGENDEAKSPGSEMKKSRLQPNRWITGLKKALSTRSFDVDECEKNEVEQCSAQIEDPAGVAEESGADNRTVQADQHASDSVTSGTSALGEEAEPNSTENKLKGVSVDDPGERGCSSDANGSGVGQPPADWNTSHPNPNDQPEEPNDVTVATGANDEAKSPGSEIKKSRLQPNRWITGLKKALSKRSFDVDECEKSEVEQHSAQTEDPAGVAEESGADKNSLQVEESGQSATDCGTSGPSVLADDNIGANEVTNARRYVGQSPADRGTLQANTDDQPKETYDGADTKPDNEEAKSPVSEIKKSRLQQNRWITGLRRALSNRSFDVDEFDKSEVGQRPAQTDLQVDQTASESGISGPSTFGDNDNSGGPEAERKPTENNSTEATKSRLQRSRWVTGIKRALSSSSVEVDSAVVGVEHHKPLGSDLNANLKTESTNDENEVGINLIDLIDKHSELKASDTQLEPVAGPGEHQEQSDIVRREPAGYEGHEEMIPSLNTQYTAKHEREVKRISVESERIEEQTEEVIGHVECKLSREDPNSEGKSAATTDAEETMNSDLMYSGNGPNLQEVEIVDEVSGTAANGGGLEVTTQIDHVKNPSESTGEEACVVSEERRTNDGGAASVFNTKSTESKARSRWIAGIGRVLRARSGKAEELPGAEESAKPDCFVSMESSDFMGSTSGKSPDENIEVKGEHQESWDESRGKDFENEADVAGHEPARNDGDPKSNGGDQ